MTFCWSSNNVPVINQPICMDYCQGNNLVPVFHLPMRAPQFGNRELLRIQWENVNPCQQETQYVNIPMGNKCNCSQSTPVPVFHLPMKTPEFGNKELFQVQWHQTEPCEDSPQYVDIYSRGCQNTNAASNNNTTTANNELLQDLNALFQDFFNKLAELLGNTTNSSANSSTTANTQNKSQNWTTTIKLVGNK